MANRARYRQGWGRSKPGPWARPDAQGLGRGLTGWWLFNEGGGSGLYNPAGGARVSGASYAAGRFGGPALSCAGSGGPNSNGASFLQGMTNSKLTVLAWVQLAGTQQSRCFVDAFGNPGSVNRGWALGVSDSSNNVVKWYTAAAGVSEDTIVSTTTLTNGAWYQCVGSSDGTTKRLYVNGVQEASAGWAHDPDYGSVFAAWGTLASLGIQNFNGLIDHALIWDRALSAAEVWQLYQQPFAPFPQTAPSRPFWGAGGGGGGGGGGSGHLLGTLGVGG